MHLRAVSWDGKLEQDLQGGGEGEGSASSGIDDGAASLPQRAGLRLHYADNDLKADAFEEDARGGRWWWNKRGWGTDFMLGERMEEATPQNVSLSFFAIPPHSVSSFFLPRAASAFKPSLPSRDTTACFTSRIYLQFTRSAFCCE